MKQLTSTQLREIRKKFRISKQHTELSEVSLIADKSSTALFNVAGMQPLIPYLMGKEHPLGKRLFNIQKCIRTVDIDEVGDSSHLTFFEMMWNRSLWDYFKKEAVSWSREFLTNYLEMDPRKLAVTVFEGDDSAPKDEETASHRKEVGLSVERISYLPAKHNRWSPGPVGPCGPDTEIFYRVGSTEFPPEGSNVKTDEENWMEIWNNVFMEYYRDESWKLSKLSKQNVDTGMGFERMCSVLQEKSTVYETDLFASAIMVIEKYSELKYKDNQKRFRIIADHARTAFMLINDGLIPSNIAAGYVLRMIIRRLVYNMMLLKDISLQEYQSFLQDILYTYKDLRNFNQSEILRVMLEEITSFKKTIQNGMLQLRNMIAWQVANKVWWMPKQSLPWKDIFKLYETYGFPFELTKEIAKEQWFEIDEGWYHKLLEESKEKSRQATKDMFKKGIDRSKYLEGVPQTEFIGYKVLETETPKLLKEIDIEGQKVLIFDKTPFYPEMGGQTWDSGSIELDSWEIKHIINTQKFAGVILHFIQD